MARTPEADYLAAIIESSDDAIISKTLQGVITSWNPAAERMFGYTAAEAVGRHITMLFPADRLEEESEFLRKISHGSRLSHFETVRLRKDGRRIDVSITLSPIEDTGGRIVGVSNIARDISERKQVDADRAELLTREREARRILEQANTLKDEFLTTLSHELRTPVNAVLGWACILRDHKDRDVVRRGVDAIIRNARLQASLIADLLDVSHIITGGLRLDVRVLDPATIMQSAVDAVRPAAQAKGLTLALDATIGEALVWADAPRLQQVLWNILINAVKFTPKGGQVIARLSAGAEGVTIRVTDTGMGIPPDLLPRIFDRFRQGDPSQGRELRGLGLGLAIARYLVELHGGTVSAASDGAGRGATITVSLPLAIVRPDAADSAVPGSLAGTRVLVVEGHEDARLLVRLALERAGAEVVAVRSADEALKAVSTHAIDAIVSDIAMPDKDGLVLIGEIRERQRTSGVRTPALALTALVSPSERAAALAAGFDRHVAKPIDPSTLPHLVGELLSRRR